MNIEVTFKSDLFKPFLPEEAQVNPNCYGAELAYWLAQKLAENGFVTSYYSPPMESDHTKNVSRSKNALMDRSENQGTAVTKVNVQFVVQKRSSSGTGKKVKIPDNMGGNSGTGYRKKRFPYILTGNRVGRDPGMGLPHAVRPGRTLWL